MARKYTKAKQFHTHEYYDTSMCTYITGEKVCVWSFDCNVQALALVQVLFFFLLFPFIENRPNLLFAGFLHIIAGVFFFFFKYSQKYFKCIFYLSRKRSK